MHPRPERIHVIANPAQERRVSLLKTLNHRFRPVGIEWQISITHRSGDAFHHTRNALSQGAELIAVYGGDGTVMEVASALVGTNVPLLILPGGTGNLVAHEVGSPLGVSRACKRICGDTFDTRTVDVGKMGNHCFLLRIGCGFESRLLQDATRELKNQFGKWAYLFAAIKALQQVPIANYRLTLDGKETIESPGVACAVANAGTTGIGNLTLGKSVGITDGKLDVILVQKADIEGIFELATKFMGLQKDRTNDPEEGLDASHLVNHWQVEKVFIESNPELNIQADGDLIPAHTPQLIEVLPRALHVVA